MIVTTNHNQYNLQYEQYYSSYGTIGRIDFTYGDSAYSLGANLRFSHYAGDLIEYLHPLQISSLNEDKFFREDIIEITVSTGGVFRQEKYGDNSIGFILV
jgi:hypothetical protein